MVKIRQAKIADIKAIEKIYRQKIDELSKKEIVQWNYDEVTWIAFSRDYDINNFYLVLLDDEIVGCFILVDYDPTYWLKDKPQEALYIHKVMVLDKVSKQGVSDLILTYFKEETKKRGYSVAKLDVREYKQKLRKFYERNGFELSQIVDLKKGYLTCLYTYKIK